MFLNDRLAVVIPAFNESGQLPKVVAGLPECVDFAVVVDDASTDRPVRPEAFVGAAVRVIVVRHQINRGVGAAIETGYVRALDEGADLIAVMAGDGQMDPVELPRLAAPVARGQTDYAKANRLARLEYWREIPKPRLLGNLALSLATQTASGFWGLWDSQTGYTVINRKAALELVRLGIYPRYGCPNDILIKLAGLGFRAKDVPTRPVYYVGEKSNLKIRRVLVTIPGILVRGWIWRLRYQHAMRRHTLALSEEAASSPPAGPT